MKLTAKMLQKIIKEELGKEPMTTKEAADEVEEYDADELADSIVMHVDMLKVLKIEEAKCLARLSKIAEKKAAIARVLAK